MASCCKVGRGIEEFDLVAPASETSLNEYLVDRWIGEDRYEPTGIRPLADWYNKSLIKRELRRNDEATLNPLVDAIYEVLTSDDDITRGEMKDQLRGREVDVDRLIDLFASPTTLYRHLTGCLDVSKPDEGGSEWEETSLEVRRDRMRELVGDALSSLDGKGRLPGGALADVDIPIMVSCPECSRRLRLGMALDRGSICPEHLGTARGTDGSGSLTENG